MAPVSEFPAPVVDALRLWLAEHERSAPQLIEGLYVVGSVALGDWRAGSDIDIVAVTADPATGDDAQRLSNAAAAVRARLGPNPTIDGPIVPWSDLTSPPLAALRPWTLDGEFHDDGECFEINPITWYTLANHGLTVVGAPTDRLGVYVDDEDLRRWVVANVDTYWRGVGQQLLAVLERSPERSAFDADVVEWCVLGVARMLFTATTGGVASKSAAGRWATDQLPHRGELFADAVRIRSRHDPAETVERATLEATATVVGEVVDLIAG